MQLGDGEVAYRVVRTVGRRHVHFVYDEWTGLELRVPFRFSADEADRLVAKHRTWIEKTLAREHVERPALASGLALPLLDERITLDVRNNHTRRARREGDNLVVPPGTANEVRAALEAWYRTEARLHFSKQLQLWAPRLGLRRPKRLTVRGQKTRWGSCSEKGTLSFNWRLMFLRRSVVDYVVVHELAHLYHLDHSSQFWRCVAGVMPQYRELRAELARANPFPF